MGIGYLFFAFCFFLDIPYGALKIDLFSDLWAYLLLFAGAVRLTKQEPSFGKVCKVLYPAIGLEILVYGTQFAGFLGFSHATAVLTVLRICEVPIRILVQAVVLLALYRLAQGAAAPALARAVSRTLTVGVVFALCRMATVWIRTLCTSLSIRALAIAMLGVDLFAFVWIFWCLALLLRFYFGFAARQSL